jgi:hypothetical protein
MSVEEVETVEEREGEERKVRIIKKVRKKKKKMGERKKVEEIWAKQIDIWIELKREIGNNKMKT